MGGLVDHSDCALYWFVDVRKKKWKCIFEISLHNLSHVAGVLWILPLSTCSIGTESAAGPERFVLKPASSFLTVYFVHLGFISQKKALGCFMSPAVGVVFAQLTPIDANILYTKVFTVKWFSATYPTLFYWEGTQGFTERLVRRKLWNTWLRDSFYPWRQPVNNCAQAYTWTQITFEAAVLPQPWPTEP